MTRNTEEDYKDIISLSRPVSTAHPPMPLSARAAQFSPFAALTGYESAIRETARQTQERKELEEDYKALLNERLELLRERLLQGQRVRAGVVCFVPDERKAGGAYRSLDGYVKKLDEYAGKLFFEDGRSVSLQEIIELEFQSLQR